MRYGSGEWKYELPNYYDLGLNRESLDEEAIELIFYESPFVFSVRVYENCLELVTIYKYRFLYEDEKNDYLN